MILGLYESPFGPNEAHRFGELRDADIRYVGDLRGVRSLILDDETDQPLVDRQRQVLDMLDAMRTMGIQAGFRPLMGQRFSPIGSSSPSLENTWHRTYTEVVLTHYAFLIDHPAINDVMLSHEAYRYTDRAIRAEMRGVVKRWSSFKINLRIYYGDTRSFGYGHFDFGDEGHHIIHWGMNVGGTAAHRGYRLPDMMSCGSTMATIMRRSYPQAPIYAHVNVMDDAEETMRWVLQAARFRSDVLMVRLADHKGQSHPATPAVLDGIRKAHEKLHRFDD